MTSSSPIVCAQGGCGQPVVQEKDDPWVHEATGEERCSEDSDNFAVPDRQRIPTDLARAYATSAATCPDPLGAVQQGWLAGYEHARLAALNAVQCICDPAYKDRGLEAPECARHDLERELNPASWTADQERAQAEEGRLRVEATLARMRTT